MTTKPEKEKNLYAVAYRGAHLGYQYGESKADALRQLAEKNPNHEPELFSVKLAS